MDFTGSVLDAETGELLEYRHLIKRPRYKDEWVIQLGTKLDAWHNECLVETMVPISKFSFTRKKWQQTG